jgi:outer membrane protein
MMIFKKTLFAIALSSLFAISANAFTIYDAIISAHENNNDISARINELKAAKMNRPIAYSGFLPTVQVGSTYNNTMNKKGPNKGLKNEYGSGQISVSQNLYQGGGTLSTVKKFDELIDATYESFKAASYNLSYNVVNAYEGVEYARAVLQLSDENEKLAKKNLEFTEIRFKYGDTTKTDIYLSEASYEQARAQKEQAIGQLSSALATFKYTVGVEFPNHVEPILIDDTHVPNNLNELLTLALNNNPNIKAARAAFNAAKQDVNISRARALPTVDAQASANRSTLRKADIIYNQNTDYNQVMVSVSMPIINTSIYPQISQSSYTADQRKFEFYDTEEKVRAQAIQAWSTFKAAKAIILASKKSVEASKNALDGTEEEVRIGTKTTIDLLQAQTGYYQSQVSLRDAERQYKLGVYGILQLIGFIDTVELADIKTRATY